MNENKSSPPQYRNISHIHISHSMHREVLSKITPIVPQGIIFRIPRHCCKNWTIKAISVCCHKNYIILPATHQLKIK